MKTKLKFGSIRTRLAFWFLTVALVPLAIVVVIIYNQRVQSIKEEAFHKLTAIRNLKVNEVNAWLDERTGDIRTISEDFEVRDLEEAVYKTKPSENDSTITSNARELLNRYLKNYRDYHEIFIVNPISGIVEISTDTSHEGQDKSKDQYFTEPLQTRQFFVKDIYFSKTLKRPSMSFSVPIYCLSHDGDHVSGILVARVELTRSLYALLLNRTGMGKTGETLIITEDGVALNELRWYEHAPLRLRIQAEPAFRGSRGETGIVETTDYRGEEVLAAYTHVPKTKWGFVAKQDLKEIYEPIRSLVRNLLTLFVISAMVVFGISIPVARSIARPALEMTDVSKRIQEGDLSARNQVQSADEFGYLAETFNRMADSISSQIVAVKTAEDQLRKERDSLEKQVQQRTLTLKQELEERKRAEDRIREQNEFLNTVIESLAHPFMVIDANDYTIRLANSAAGAGDFSRRPTCYSISHKRSKPCEGAEHPCPLDEVKKSKKPVTFEHIHYDRHGNAKNVEVHGYPVFDKDGSVVQMIEYYLDVTERKRAEEALRTSEEKYRGIYDESVAAIYVFDAKKNFVDSNQAGLDLLGYSRDELLRMSIPDVDADPVVVLPAHEQLLSGERLVNYEHQLKKKDGTIITVLNNSRPLTDVDGNAVGMQSTLIDITERKRAEETLRESEEKYRTLVETAQEGIGVTDPDENLTFVNQAFADLLGYTKEELLALNLSQICDEEEFAKLRKESKKRQRGQSSRYEAKLYAKTGEVKYFDVSATPLVEEKGTVTASLAFLNDITERKRAEEALRQYEHIVSSSTDMLALLDKRFNYLAANIAYMEAFKLTPEQLIGNTVAKVFGEELFNTVIKPNADRCLGGEEVNYQDWFDFPAHGRRYMDITYYPYYGKDNKIMGFVVNGRDMTERKKAEEELRESEEKIKSILDSSPDAITVTDLDGNIIECNQATLYVHGFSTKEEVIGKNALDFIAPKDHKKVAENTEKTLMQGSVRNVEYTLFTKDGREFPGELSASVICDSSGKPTSFVAITKDITERKRAEEDLKNVLHEWRVTFDSAKDLIMMLDAGFKVSRANLATAWFLDRPIKEIAGKTCYQLLHGTDRPPEGCPLEKMRKTKKHQEKEFYLSEKDIWILASVDPILDDKGNVTGAVHIIRDITERKRAEEVLRLQSEIAANMSEGVYLIRASDGVIVYTNPKFEEIFGYGPDEMLGKHVSIVNAPTEKSPEETAKEISEFINKHGFWRGEINNIKKDGTPFWCYSSVSMFDHPEHGRVWVVVHTDITERKKMEAQLMQSERLTAVGTLAYGIAHEFNNILAGILGNAEFGMGSGDSKEVEECFRVIMENCDKAGSITNSLLTLARQRQVKKEVADLTDAVENILGLVERELEKQNIRVERKFKPVPEIVCDLGELSEVFLNMITNARDAMKPDGGTLIIELRKRNRNIEIIFADTGGGIPDEIKGRIFEPFVTTKGALGQSEIPGTGLGLFLSIGIISRYHGKIEVESQVGKGSKFTIRIPVTQNQQLPDRAEAEDEGPTVLPTDLKVLLVDDEETICNVVKKFLEEKGFSVVDTTSGKEGLKLFKDGTFDLVLSDITMPDMDGVKLISELKNLNPDIRIVTLTGHVAEEKLEAARKAGADQILLKPFRKEYLYRAIGRALSV